MSWSVALGMATVMAAFTALLGGLYLIQRRWQVRPELVRKLFHIGGGLLAIAAPQLFAATWPPVALALLLTATLAAVRTVRLLRDTVGDVLYGVGRESWGEIYFPVGVAVLLVLSGGTGVEFVLPMLILAFADPAAALVGNRYGVVRFASLGGRKTVEGSVTFMLTAFGTSALALLGLSDLSVPWALALATNLAVIMTLVEGSVCRGADNLLIPVLAFILLEAFLALDDGQLAALATVTTGVAIAATSLSLRLRVRRLVVLRQTEGAGP